jgi:16S rRNA processing protein RimM
MSRLAIGYVARAHGLRGELRVHTHDPESATLLEVRRVWIGGAERVVEAARPTSGAVLLLVAGIADRDAAEALKGQAVEVAREDVPLDEGEYLLADLPGCEVSAAGGASLGRVVEVMPAAQPLLVVHGAGLERLIPVVPDFVKEVDLAARRIVVALPEDLPAEPIR